MSKRYRVIVEIGGQRLFSGSLSQCEQYIRDNGLVLEYRSSAHPHLYVSGV